jgi:hypothetical protein
VYENGKMRHVETVPGMWEGGIKENSEEGKFNFGKIFYKCHNVSPGQQ